MLFKSRLTETDRQIIHQIEIEIKNHPDRYVGAGKWLDEEYYTEEKYWQRRVEKQERLTSNNPDAFEDFSIAMQSIGIRASFHAVRILKNQNLRYFDLFTNLGMKDIPRKERAKQMLEILEEKKKRGQCRHKGAF